MLTTVPGTFSEIQPTGEHSIADGSVKPAGATTSKFGSSSAKNDSPASFVQASQAPCDPGLVRTDIADKRGMPLVHFYIVMVSSLQPEHVVLTCRRPDLEKHISTLPSYHFMHVRFDKSLLLRAIPCGKFSRTRTNQARRLYLRARTGMRKN